MTDREKLIELLQRNEIEYTGYLNKVADAAINDDVFERIMSRIEFTADHLIANGVTVQRWIPASEPPKDSEPVLVCTKHRRPFKARYLPDRGRWDVSHSVKITHWMPLPEPPKEVG